MRKDKFKIIRRKPGYRIMEWEEFLLKHICRPHQPDLLGDLKIKGIRYVTKPSAPHITDQTSPSFWLDSEGFIYSDKMAAFALACDNLKNGGVVHRLSRYVSHVAQPPVVTHKMMLLLGRMQDVGIIVEKG